MRIAKLLPALALIGLLAACGDKDDDEKANKPPESAEQLYSEAYQQFGAEKYKESVKSFEEVERQHPSSEWATRAQVMSGYASYQAEDYDTAISTLQRFTKLYPNNPSTPYSYYLIALCYYEQINDVGRDQKVTEQALQALREVIRRFPDTEYARDAKIKLDLTTDHLAGKEMEIGRWYLRHDDMIAAINRFRFVVENYQTTSHVPEALHRLVEAYLKLGVEDEAQRYAAVLGTNFPGSVWYRDSYRLMKEAGPVKYADMTKPVDVQEEKPAQPAEVKPVESKNLAPPADTNPPESDASWWDSMNPFAGSAPAQKMPQKPAQPAEVKLIDSHEPAPAADTDPPAAPSTSFLDHLNPFAGKDTPPATASLPESKPAQNNLLVVPPADENSPPATWWGNLNPFAGSSKPAESKDTPPASPSNSWWDHVLP